MRYLAIVFLFVTMMVNADPLVAISEGDKCEKVVSNLKGHGVNLSVDLDEESIVLTDGYFGLSEKVYIHCLEITGIRFVKLITTFESAELAAEKFKEIYYIIASSLGRYDERLTYIANRNKARTKSKYKKVFCWNRKYGMTGLKIDYFKNKWHLAYETGSSVSC